MSLRFGRFYLENKEYLLLASGGKDKYIRLYRFYDSLNPV
jgi:hypothetical protein